MMKSFPRIRPIMIIVAWALMGTAAEFQAGQKTAVEDVFKVMEPASAEKMNALWPNFHVSEIPVLVYDGLSTYLFNSKTIPDGFAKTKENPRVYVYEGQHPQARGNSIIRLGESWAATSVLSRTSRRTGDTYGLKDMAGIIIHEQFHVFQRIRHPRWRQNDGVLLFYPTDAEQALFLRRAEKEAFRKAVTADNPADTAGWAKQALRYREDRLARLASPFSVYEKELQRTEGLSDYIERIARGSDPLNASQITNGIAPAGVRDLGYVEGRWIAMILDRLSPGWKSVLEENDSLYLEDILKNAADRVPGDPKSFAAGEFDRLKSEAAGDIGKWKENTAKEIEAFNNQPGFRVEIRASSNPLTIRIFEPLEMEILEDGGVYHRLIFSAASESGSLRIMNQPCLTYFDRSYRLTRLIIRGLKTAPEIMENEKTFRIKDQDITIEFKFKAAAEREGVYTIEL